MSRLILHGATLIDGTGADPVPNATIVVENGVVTAVGSGGAAAAESSATFVDLTGRHIIPGLWDSHTHFYDWMGELYLAHGVTTIVDVGNYLDWILAQRDAIEKGRVRAPRLLVCGHALGGHPVFAAQKHMSLVLDGPEDARKKARCHIDRGVNGVKMWVFSTTAEIAAAAEEASAANLPVIGHLSTSAADAARAGLTVLAHATGLAPACVRDPVLAEELVEAERRRIRGLYTHEQAPSAAWMHCQMQEDTFDEVIELFLSRGVFIEPDLVFKWIFAMENLCERYEAEDYVEINSPGLEYIPPYAHRRLAVAWNGRRQLDSGRSDEIKRAFEKLCTFLCRFVQAGGRLLAGSDTTTWPLPGRSIAREIEILVSTLGLSPLEAIRCATSYPAESMNRSDTLGTIRPGQIADLVVLADDPLANIRTLERPLGVYQRGEAVDLSYHSDYSNPIPKPNIGLTHAYPIPRIHDGSPASTRQGERSLRLTLHGAGFVSSSVVLWDGVPVTTNFRSWDTIEAEIPDYLLARPGTFPVVVRNPQPIRTVDYLHDDDHSNVFEVVVAFA